VKRRVTRTQLKAPSPSRYSVQAAVKTLEVLFAFRGATGPLVVPEVAARLGMSRNQVYRCFKTLEAVGIVQEEARGFSLTDKLLELVPAMTRESLLAVAEPLLLQLRNDTGETVNLVVPVDRDEAVCIATYATTHSIGLLTRVGQRSRYHAGAVPKAMLAFMPPEQVEHVLASLPSLPRYTPATQTDPEHLRAEIEAVRQRGYSVTDGDFEEGARGVGVPIFGPDGWPVGGLSVGGPMSRVDQVALDRLAALALATGAAISQRLGYRGRPAIVFGPL
jgi:DNA-binding IclR family transcriptional regulator